MNDALDEALKRAGYGNLEGLQDVVDVLGKIPEAEYGNDSIIKALDTLEVIFPEQQKTEQAAPVNPFTQYSELLKGLKTR